MKVGDRVRVVKNLDCYDDESLIGRVGVIGKTWDVDGGVSVDLDTASDDKGMDMTGLYFRQEELELIQ